MPEEQSVRRPVTPSWRNAMRSTASVTRRTAILWRTFNGPSQTRRERRRTLWMEGRTEWACQTQRVTRTHCGNVPTRSFTAQCVQHCQTTI